MRDAPTIDDLNANDGAFFAPPTFTVAGVIPLDAFSPLTCRRDPLRRFAAIGDLQGEDARLELS